MRQIATLRDGAEAHRFVAFLITEGIHAQVESDEGNWAIWVRDENRVDAARSHLQDFLQNPQREVYRGVESRAEQIMEQERQEREAAAKNTIEMRGRWGRAGGGGRKPFVMAVIGICVVLGLLTNFGRNRSSTVSRTLMFCDQMQLEGWNPDSLSDRLIDIRAGQVWRVVTPIFLHGSIWHIAFNMIMFYQLGGAIEARRGTLRLAVMTLVFAVVSNLLQALAPTEWGGTPFFLGMSGVVYAYLGYIWMKNRYEPELGLYINPNALTFLLVWMLLGFLGVMESFGIHVANWAHGGGFAIGCLVGAAPRLLRG